jgi:hypothetical protein
MVPKHQVATAYFFTRSPFIAYQDWTSKDRLKNCIWSLPEQRILVQSPTGLMTIFYTLTALANFKIQLKDRICFEWYIRIQFERRKYVSSTEPNRLKLFKETAAVYCENQTDHTDTLCGQNAVRSSQETNYVSTTEPNRLMLFGETMTEKISCFDISQAVTTLPFASVV